MDISDIDFIAAPAERGAASDFDLLRAVVRRHVLADEGQWLNHPELVNAIERRRIAAADDQHRLAKRTLLERRATDSSATRT